MKTSSTATRTPVGATDERIAALRRDITFEDELLGHRLNFRTTWGLFSPRHIDDGSRLLLDHLHVERDDVAMDLGCGYGPIGLALARSAPLGSCLLVDKDFVAVDYARRNATLNDITNVGVQLSNGFDQVPDGQFSLIVSNLPAKSSNEQYFLFFHDAYQHLRPGGRLVVVSISGIREFIARNLRDVFGNYDKLKQGKAYTVASSVKQLPQSQGRTTA